MNRTVILGASGVEGDAVRAAVKHALDGLPASLRYITITAASHVNEPVVAGMVGKIVEFLQDQSNATVSSILAHVIANSCPSDKALNFSLASVSGMAHLICAARDAALMSRAADEQVAAAMTNAMRNQTKKETE